MAYKDRQESYERYARRRINRALRLQIEPLLNYIDEDNVMLIDMYLTRLVSPEPVARALLDVYVSVMPREAVAIAKEVDRILPRAKRINGISFFSEYWKRWMREAFETIAGTMITAITETTRDHVRQLMSEAREQNLSFRDMAKYITEGIRSRDFTRARSLTIARTETTRAANIGQQQMAETSNIELLKAWNVRVDGRERASHRAMSGAEPIARNAPFIVGGYPMQHPGDESAPAAETVNCRCSMSFRPVLDADGLPVTRATGLERDLFTA